MTDFEIQSAIIDNGSGMCKAGMSGGDAPSTSFPSIVGRPKTQNMMLTSSKDYYIGE